MVLPNSWHMKNRGSYPNPFSPRSSCHKLSGALAARLLSYLRSGIRTRWPIRISPFCFQRPPFFSRRYIFLSLISLIFPGVPCGINSRLTAQSLNHKAGVVGQRQEGLKPCRLRRAFKKAFSSNVVPVSSTSRSSPEPLTGKLLHSLNRDSIACISLQFSFIIAGKNKFHYSLQNRLIQKRVYKILLGRTPPDRLSAHLRRYTLPAHQAALDIAKTIPPFAVPSSFVRTIPVIPAVSANCFACKSPF